MKNLIITISIFICILYFENINAQAPMCDTDQITAISKAQKGNDIPTPTYPSPPPPPPGPQPGEGEYRHLYWVHGLNGSEESWTQASSAVNYGVPGFPARKVYTYKNDYNSHQQTLQTASTHVKEEMAGYQNSYPTNKLSGIVIAHSQGGLVSRQLDMHLSQSTYNPERNFGGIVTVASANQGAEILNKEVEVEDGETGHLTALVEDFADNLSAGPKAEIIHTDDFIFRMVGKKINVGDLLEKIQDFLMENFIKYLADVALPGIVEQLTVGSPSIDALNDYEPTIIDEDGNSHATKLVAFFAVRDTLTMESEVVLKDDISLLNIDENGSPSYIKEDRIVKNVPVPISWATLNYFLTSPNDIGHPDDPTMKNFTAHFEEAQLAAKMHLTRLDYEGRVEINNGLYHVYRAEARRHRRRSIFFLPSLILAREYEKAAGRAREKELEWQKGVDYLDNFDHLFRIATGAKHIVTEHETKTVVKCVCKLEGSQDIIHVLNPTEHCGTVYPNHNYPMGYDCSEESDTWSWTTRTWHHKESDGIVLAESAKYIPQATFRDDIRLKLNGSTHMCVRNDRNTKEMLLKVFDGDVGLFFETEEK